MRILLSSHQTPAPNGDVCRAEERPRRESAALKGSDSDGRRVKKRAASGLRFAPALAQGLVTQSHGHDTTSPRSLARRAGAPRGAGELPAAAVREQCALPAVSRAMDLCAERDGRGPLLLLGKTKTETDPC